MSNNRWLSSSELSKLNQLNVVHAFPMGLYVQRISLPDDRSKVDRLWGANLDINPAHLELIIISTINQNPRLLDEIEGIELYHSTTPLRTQDNTPIDFFIDVLACGYKKKDYFDAITSLLGYAKLNKVFRPYSISIVYADRKSAKDSQSVVSYDVSKLGLSKKS